MTGFQQIAEELREFTALKYAGDCKCGKCQLVPRSVLDRTLATLSRLAASRPATQVVDREAVARIIKNHVSVTVSGNAYAPRDNDRDGVASAADAILSLFRRAEPVEAERPDTVAQRTWFDGENIRTENLTADDIYQKPDAVPDAVVEPVAWRLRTTNGSSHNYCHVVIDGELEIWKHNWASHLAQGTAVLEPLYTHPPKSPDTSEAVLAERERCAAIAESFFFTDKMKANTNGARTDGNDRACMQIANAIRQLPTPERGDK